MTDIPISIAKDKFSELIRRAEAGEAITITRFGKPVMDMVPLRAETNLSSSVGSSPVMQTSKP